MVIKMWVTERDMQLMQWMNRVGFVTIEHIAKWLGVAIPTAYVRMKKLVSNDYVIHERILHGAHGIYRVSHKGVHISGRELPPLRQVRLGTYHHDLKVVDLSFVLLARHGGSFIYERELRHQLGPEQRQVGKSGHTSDGILMYDNKKIPIEVELTTKGKRRLESIFNHYMRQFDNTEVWYFCGSETIRQHLMPVVRDVDFFKLHLLESFLA